MDDVEAGWIVDCTPESVAEGLTKLSEASPEMLRKRGERARQLVSNRFTWFAAVGEMTRVYAEILG